jgi:DMSO/TMAO reductase YedYZ heme-binding membrane subunit
MLRKTGLSSNVMYTMGLASIGASVASWVMSRNMESAGVDRADRWGIFVGLWAPTFLTIGCAMRLEEQAQARGARRQMENSVHRPGERSRESMPVGA